MPLIITVIAIFLYLSATLLLWTQSRRGSGRLSPVCAIAWGSAMGFHAIDLNLFQFGGEQIDLSFFKAVSLTMLLVSLLLLLSCIRRPLAVLGIVVLPVTIGAILLEHANAGAGATVSKSHLGIQLHVVSSFLAYSFLNLSGIQAIAVYMQDRRLKRSSLPGPLAALPSLDAMESFLFNLLAIGLLLLTASIASGWIYHEDLFAQHLVHKTVLSMAAWLFFFAVLAGRVLFGWRGRSAWKTVLSGIVLLILAYLGSKFVLELILHRV